MLRVLRRSPSWKPSFLSHARTACSSPGTRPSLGVGTAEEEALESDDNEAEEEEPREVIKGELFSCASVSKKSRFRNLGLEAVNPSSNPDLPAPARYSTAQYSLANSCTAVEPETLREVQLYQQVKPFTVVVVVQ